MNRYFNIAIATIILAGAFTAGARAQTVRSQPMLANIPFDFHVGSKKLSAGKYTITVINPSSDRKVLQIRSRDGRSVAITQTTGFTGTASEKTKLVFHRYGDQYFFAQAQMAGDTMGLAALKSNMERAQKHTLARAAKKTVVVFAE